MVEAPDDTVDRLCFEAGKMRMKITLLSGLLTRAVDLMPRHLPSCEIYQTDFCTCGYDQFRKNVRSAISD